MDTPLNKPANDDAGAPAHSPHAQAPRSHDPKATARSDQRLRRLVLFGGLLVVIALAWRGTLLPGGEDLVSWEQDYAAAASTASETGKPLLLYFGAEWCGACRHLERRVFSQERVAAQIERDYVPVKVDSTDPGPWEQRMAYRYGVEALPTLVIADSDGALIAQQVGTLPAGQLLDWLDANLRTQNSSRAHPDV